MKLCYGCKHFEFDTGSPAYSELTPGDAWQMICHKEHWRMDMNSPTSNLGPNLERAETCEDYEEPTK